MELSSLEVHEESGYRNEIGVLFRKGLGEGGEYGQVDTWMGYRS